MKWNMLLKIDIFGRWPDWGYWPWRSYFCHVSPLSHLGWWDTGKGCLYFFPLFILNCVSKDIPFDHLLIYTQAEESIEFINSVNFLRIIFFSWWWKQYSLKKEEEKTPELFIVDNRVSLSSCWEVWGWRGRQWSQMVVISGLGGQSHSGIILELLNGWGTGWGSRVCLEAARSKGAGPRTGDICSKSSWIICVWLLHLSELQEPCW